MGIRLALLPFGTVHDISYQRFAGFKTISIVTRIVRMSLKQHIPFQCNIQGYPCRVWYAGQPLRCTICKGAHKAADCPDRNKCKLCHQSGHFAKNCKNAWGTTPQSDHAQAGPPPRPPASDHVPPPAPDSALPPSSHPPAPDPSVPDPSAPAPSPGPATPSAPVPPATSSVDGAAGSVPPPLMSVTVQPPQQSLVGEPVSSQETLFGDTEDSIAEFSEDESPLVSPSPSISSFPSDNCSQSVLKDVSIVSSDPMEVEQNVSSVNSNVTDKSNVTGPKVTQGESNVTGPKVAQSKCNVKGQKVTQDKSNSNVTGPKVTQIKSKSSSNVTGQGVAHMSNDSGQTDLPNSQNSQKSQGQIQQHVSSSPSGKLVDSDSSSSESPFKAPLPPRPRRTASSSPLRGRSRSPLVPDSPGAHRGMPQVPRDRPSRRS